MSQTDLFREEAVEEPRYCTCPVGICREEGWPRCRTFEVYIAPSARFLAIPDSMVAEGKPGPNAIERMMAAGLRPVFRDYDSLPDVRSEGRDT